MDRTKQTARKSTGGKASRKQLDSSHREALKQSAIDPLSGKIDVSILTTGVSAAAAARKRRKKLTEALKKLIQSKGKVPSVNYQKTLTEMKESMQILVTRDKFEDSLKELQDNGVVIVVGRNTIRIC
ncbi:hypothetical protein HCN44_009983 [Aphidius gifuensis]|uniref:Uncharacterized protein n=1 Tax=Aphidius gifuensis TaxID=684658 RepID=A0A834Y1V3_APHGI|nr:hypothetical protein HCN44_009983 [Aphidius gifuensis]